jgi:glutamate synthase (NADPH/NADH) large chain
MTKFDEMRLKQLIQRHYEYTASSVAKRILEHWNEYLPKFVKVMPMEYRRVLTDMQARQIRPPQSLKLPQALKDVAS